MKTKILKTLFLFAMILSVPHFANASNYFNWGVEGSKMYYGDVMGQYNVQYFGGTTKDCTTAHTGSCSMKLQVIGNDSGNQQMGADNIIWNPVYQWGGVGGGAVYYRWWMKIMPGFNWGSGTAKTKSSRVISGAQGYTGYLMHDGFLIGECASGGCTLNELKYGSYSNSTDAFLKIPYDFTVKNDGQWHEYVVKVKPNTLATCVPLVDCDAQFGAWVDGSSVGEYNNFKLHNNASDSVDEAWGGWMVRPYFQLNGTASDGGTIYLDDFSTDDTFNSSISSSGDAVAPAAPSGLTVQ